MLNEDEIDAVTRTNAALTKRVAELEAKTQMLDTHVGHWASKALTLEGTERHLRRVIADLQSQLAWTPVRDGLPTEPGETVLVRQRRTGGCIYGLLWNNGTALHAVTEEQPCGLYEYGSPSEAMRDWDEFLRLPEEGAS